MISRTINQYRYYCTTESNIVYKWDLSAPTTCPNSSSHTIDPNSITIIDSIANTQVTLPNANLIQSPFEELKVEQKTTVIDLKSVFGRSLLRDIYSSNGNGSITNNIGGNGEYTLSVSGVNDIAQLSSAERGRYIAGMSAEVGIGVRTNTYTLSNTQQAKWGYFDESNGFYFLMNSNGLNCAILKNGVETIYTRNNFTADSLDGNGPSGVTYNPTTGMIYNITYSWYGYGSVEFAIIARNLENKQSYIPCHRVFSSNSTTINNPNLPIRVELKNNNSPNPAAIYVGGRQYSILGKYTPIMMINSSYLSVPSPARNIFSPILSIRRKVDYKGVAIKVLSADFIANSDTFVEIRTKTTLNNPVYTNIPSQISTETAIEQDTSSTVVTGGVVIWAGIIPADKSSLRQIESLQYTISEYDIVTVLAQSISSVTGTLSVALRWSEEW